jgi:molecular chaperone DnaK
MPKFDFIGIDLGTTFSEIAHVNEHGVPEVIENAEGERTMPSVVLFDGDEIHVGSYAKDNMAVYPGQGVEFVKRFMGDRLWSFEYRGKKYNASEISSFILKKLKRDAEERLGTKIGDVVITVPAYFGDPQRRATIGAT